MKTITVVLEVIFVLCILGLTLRLFGVEQAETLAPVFYVVGGVSLVISLILRSKVKDNRSNQA